MRSHFFLSSLSVHGTTSGHAVTSCTMAYRTDLQKGFASDQHCTTQVLAVEEAAGNRSATATVRLQRSGTTVTVRCADLVETNEARAAQDAARRDAGDDRGDTVPGAYFLRLITGSLFSFNSLLNRKCCTSMKATRLFNLAELIKATEKQGLRSLCAC